MGSKFRYCPLLLVAGLVVYLLLSGRQPAPPLLHTPDNEQQIKDFFHAKEAQARQLVSIEKRELPPEIWPYFAAGRKGDWATVTNLYAKMASRTYDFKNDRRIKVSLQSMSWMPIAETYQFYLQCTQSDSKFALALGEAIMRVVPPGSIYFGDTDTGRFVPTGLCHDHAKSDPFFVLTQNALADGLYLSYLENMFGKKIQIPSEQDAKVAFDQYMQDAIKLMQSGKLQAEENLQKTEYKTSSAAIINARLSEIMFERNPNREFFVCEGYPSEWMYPYLTPHGPIMKAHRDKLDELKPDTIQRDREYWNQRVIPLIGDWVKEETTIEELCTFAIKVYILKDYHGFKGDRDYVSMATFKQTLPAYPPAAQAWSEARSAIAGVYVWRINDCARQLREIQALPIAEQNIKTEEANRLQKEQQSYLKEADFAYRQAIALDPAEPTAVYRYTSLLTSLKRFDDALRIVRVAKQLHPEAFAPLEKELLKVQPERSITGAQSASNHATQYQQKQENNSLLPGR